MKHNNEQTIINQVRKKICIQPIQSIDQCFDMHRSNNHKFNEII